jgi:hypothetical protein
LGIQLEKTHRKKGATIIVFLVLVASLFSNHKTLASASLSFHQEASPSEDSKNEFLLFTWEYIGYVYKKQFFTPLDPELKMRFRFESDKHVRLSWEASAGALRCARVAEYEIKNNFYLWQKKYMGGSQESFQLFIR